MNEQLYDLIFSIILGPSGKPRVTAAHNTSSTSLFISWQPPDLNTIHGEFEGYKISYRPRDIAQAKAIEIPIENPKAKVSKRKIKNKGISSNFLSFLHLTINNSNLIRYYLFVWSV